MVGEEERKKRGAPKIRDDRLINYVPAPGKAFLRRESRDGRDRSSGVGDREDTEVTIS